MNDKNITKRTVIFSTLMLLVLFYLVASYVPFKQHIEQTVPAIVYINGEVSGTTTVQIDGKKTNYLRPDKSDEFSGKFAIEMYEGTRYEITSAAINWIKPSEYLLFYNAILAYIGTSPRNLEMVHLLIDEDMKQFILSLEDGVVIATSEEIYQQHGDRYQ